MNEFIHQFIKIVKAYPEHIAILEDGKKGITYYTLFRKALLLSHRLKNLIFSQSLVAISQPKSIDTIVSMLAVWICGGAFVPLDPSLPDERKNNILQQAKPNIILGEKGSIRYYERQNRCPEKLAYIIFTSGSSGSPKGVMVPHEGVVNFIEEQIKVFQFSATSRSLWYLSFNFDASISDIGTALLSGATLCIETDNQLITAAALPKLIASRGLTHIDIPPSLLTIIDPLTIPKTLQTIIIGGEVCPKEFVRKWSRYFRLVNVYGPTEGTVCTSMKVCDESWEKPNIGKPIKNLSYQLCDSLLLPVKRGSPESY